MPTINIWTRRIFELEAYAVRNRVKGCVRKRDFYEKIGYSYTNLFNLRSGSQDIRPQHLYNAAREFGIDMNWFFNPAHKKMFLEANNRNPLDLLREALALLEAEKGVKKNVNSKAIRSKQIKKAAL